MVKKHPVIIRCSQARVFTSMRSLSSLHATGLWRSTMSYAPDHGSIGRVVISPGTSNQLDTQRRQFSDADRGRGKPSEPERWSTMLRLIQHSGKYHSLRDPRVTDPIWSVAGPLAVLSSTFRSVPLQESKYTSRRVGIDRYAIALNQFWWNNK